MELVRRNIDELHAPAQNVRMHTVRQLDEFVRSLKMFGQTRAAVVDENDTVLIGNGMVAAMKKMGLTEVDTYPMTNLSENQKKKLMIVDNKMYSLGIDDLNTLNQFLDELREDLDIPGFDPEVLASMTAAAEEVTEKISTYGTLDPDAIRRIQENGERKEAQIVSSNAELSADPPSQTAAPIQNEPADDESTEIRRFVVCPECGKKIWL